LSTTGAEEIRLDLDGEEGNLLPITVECIPRALTLIIPSGDDFLSES